MSENICLKFKIQARKCEITKIKEFTDVFCPKLLSRAK